MLASGPARAADRVDRLRAAQKTADLWQMHYLLGVAYVEAGRFPEAIAEFDVCVKRRGEAIAIFLDDVASFRYWATLPYWQGRAQEGLGLSGPAAESFKRYLAVRSTADDPLTRDAKARLTKLASSTRADCGVVLAKRLVARPKILGDSLLDLRRRQLGASGWLFEWASSQSSSVLGAFSTVPFGVSEQRARPA